MSTDRVRIVGRVRRDLYKKVVAACRRMHVSRSLILEQALSSYLGQDSFVLESKRNGNGRSR